MKRISLEETKKVELQILIMFDKFCQEQGLAYYLFGGTLIGAIRHRGFIPWDDDIDVCMPREDYERMKELWVNTVEYTLLDEKRSDYPYSFSKIIDSRTHLVEYDLVKNPKDYGLYIDVFPINGTPMEDLDDYFFTATTLEKSIIIRGNGGVKFRKNIVLWWKDYKKWTVLRKTSLEDLRARYHELVTKYKFFNSEFVFCSGDTYGRKALIPAKFFAGGVVTVEFEGHQFPAMKRYSDVLTHYYGDYMKLPPVEKQKSHHRFKAYYKE